MNLFNSTEYKNTTAINKIKKKILKFYIVKYILCFKIYMQFLFFVCLLNILVETF